MDEKVFHEASFWTLNHTRVFRGLDCEVLQKIRSTDIRFVKLNREREPHRSNPDNCSGFVKC